MRALHWLWASLLGYFWIRCERCGRGWGGHQWRTEKQERPTGLTTGIAAYCPRCIKGMDGE